MTNPLAPLSYWLDVEAMTPPKEPLDGRQTSRRRTVRLSKTTTVDWAFRTKPGIKVVNQVRVGLFDIDAAAKEMIPALKGTIKEAPNGVGAEMGRGRAGGWRTDGLWKRPLLFAEFACPTR